MSRTLSLLFLVLLLTAPQALWAQEIEVTFQLRGDESLEQAKKRALQEGIVQLAVRRAVEMLPGQLGPERLELLGQYLMRHTSGLEARHEETGLSEGVDGLKLRLDLELREDVLRRLLERMGVFFTAGIRLPYQLSLSAPQEISAPLIASLELLTGVYHVPEAWPRLSLSFEQNTWSGGIETPGDRYDASGSDLPTLWFTLWGWYFTVHGPLPPPDMGPERSGVQLTVSGWPAPDGVYDFEHVLRGFQPAVASATLKSLVMQPSGISAVWELTVRDMDSLRPRLDAFCQSRGLRFELSGGATPQVEFGGTPATPHDSTSPQGVENVTRPQSMQGGAPAASPENLVSPAPQPPLHGQ